jgi:hypothetical protein
MPPLRTITNFLFITTFFHAGKIYSFSCMSKDCLLASSEKVIGPANIYFSGSLSPALQLIR